MQLVRVNSRSLVNFSVQILQMLVKLVQVKILELITCSATGTGMLVKTALTSNGLQSIKEFLAIQRNINSFPHNSYIVELLE